jgi:hypothetical protein
MRDAVRMELSEWQMWWKTVGHRELYDLLMLWWDPIGVKNIPEAQGEYTGYAGRLGRMLREGASEQELVASLAEAERSMRLGPKGERNALVAGKLIEWYARSMRAG